jgi:DNA-binding NtrC family response regulator
MAFKSAGYDVSCATCVGEAMQILRARGFDVILSDYSLGDGTGSDLIERATAESLLEGARVLVCTSQVHVTVPRGVPVVHKPIGYDDLLGAVARQVALCPA